MMLVAGLQFTVFGWSTNPSVLRAAVVVLARDIAVLGTATLRVNQREGTCGQGKDSDSRELHYEYYDDPITNECIDVM